MNATGMIGGGTPDTRRFKTRRTVVKDQLVCHDETSGQIAEIDAPTSVNDYTEAVGVTSEAVTYSATPTTNEGNLVSCTYHPNQLIVAKCSGGVTSGTALAAALDANILTTTGTSKTVISDANVGTSEFVGGLLWGLIGANVSEGNKPWTARTITSHSDNTSTTLTEAFLATSVAGDTFLRTFGILDQGYELTTDYVEFNMLPGAGVDLPDTGHAVIWEVECDFNNQGTRSAPLAFAKFVLIDHAFRSLA